MFPRLLTAFVSFLLICTTTQCPSGEWRQSSVDPNKCYLVSVNRKIWFEAEQFCNKTTPNGHLVSIGSAFEMYGINAVVIDTNGIALCDQLWIGASDFSEIGLFSWSDSRPFLYSNWAAGQPDLNDQCASSQARTSGQWRTQPCGIENCFICESYSSSQATSSSPRTTQTTTTTPLPTTTTTTNPTNPMSDCYDWLHIGGARTSGVYRISPPGIAPFDVYCDMDTAGGGWTVFHRRIDGRLAFWNQPWNAYKNGFNNGLQNNLWAGLDRISILSNKNRKVTLRVELNGDRNTDNNAAYRNAFWFSEWNFKIDNEQNSYTLHVDAASAGNISQASEPGNFHNYNNNMPFSTVDRGSEVNCAKEYGAWWHRSCTDTALNGPYDNYYNYYWLVHPPVGDSFFASPKRSKMMLRRNPNGN